MNVPEHVINRIHDNPVEGARSLCEFVLEVRNEISERDDEFYGLIVEAIAIFEVLVEEAQININVALPYLQNKSEYEIVDSSLSFVTSAYAELHQQAAAIQLDSVRASVRGILSKRPAYEFTDGDIEKIQSTINELRQLLVSAKDLDETHKQRMLKRLEAFQRELHKKMSDLSRFWGFMGDMGVALRKLGEDSKPIVDRYEQIMRAGWQAEARSAGLPHDSEMPKIGHDDISRLDG
ncbi:hypothetical protein [Pseudomonas sp. RC3H12]|uniref:hypothetical protein n=1 Tax=Pseudomonas sp. RC3H12 TaxID=2834406 RepID=UPI001BDE8C52|nr:hypothetical protein [Pseudomonas sp. RC3H12]QWA30694.1 hypothetical protein KHO27_07405 [Pseudomonas sp. RC3H12]